VVIVSSELAKLDRYESPGLLDVGTRQGSQRHIVVPRDRASTPAGQLATFRA